MNHVITGSMPHDDFREMFCDRRALRWHEHAEADLLPAGVMAVQLAEEAAAEFAFIAANLDRMLVRAKNVNLMAGTHQRTRQRERVLG
jgi:hypothetical protein